MSRQLYFPFVLDIYSSAFGYLDTVASPIWVTASVRWAGIDTASFAVGHDDSLNALLAAPGRRMVVRFRPDQTKPDTRDLLSGYLGTKVGDAVGAGMARTYYVIGDYEMLGMLGWPNPTGTIAEQGDEDAYYELSGPAETVALGLISLNKGEQVTPITVASSLGRGSNITVRIRMHKLPDKLNPVLSQAGVDVRLLQGDSSVEASVYTGTVHTEPLTEASGVIVKGSYTIQPPTATRVNVGGPGVGVARKWRQVIDHAAEAKWGRSWAVTADARDVKEDDVDWAAKLDARGWEVLRAGADTVSVSAQLSETTDFAFPAYDIGDTFTLEFMDGQAVTDRITRIDFSVTPQDGLEITPFLGTIEDSTEAQVMKAVSNIASSVRDLKVSV